MKRAIKICLSLVLAAGACAFVQNPVMDYVADHEWVAAPASSSAAGTAGQTAYDDNYFYVCVSNATWRRSVIASW
jgi:hypothetical protein